jgi:transcriptional regulator with XRE-family HTH domain
MSSGPGPVVSRSLLTDELSALRRESGKTQEEVATALDWSPSKLIRIEGGTVGISVSDLRSLLRHYGMDEGPRVERLVGYARAARERGWWAPYRDDLDVGYYTYIGYEAGASVIRSFQGLRVPALLQTEDYARAMTIEYVPRKEVADVVIDVRMQRQYELSHTDPPRQHYILDEAVVQRWVGAQRDPGIMPRQLRHVMELAQQPEITVEVIPFSKGAHFGLLGEFTILSFDSGLSDILYLEKAVSRASDLAIGARDEIVADYREGFENIGRLALSPEESLELCDRVATRMEEATPPAAS